MRVSKGETYERVFVNEEVNLCIEQEAGSRVKIVVVNFETSKPRDFEISNKIFIEQVGEGCAGVSEGRRESDDGDACDARGRGR